MMACELVLCALLSAVLCFLYRLGTAGHDYWPRLGVAGPRPAPFLGTSGRLLLARVSFTQFFRHLYEQFPGHKYVGLLTGSRPELLVRDPELVKRVLSKDFEYFPNRNRTVDEKHDFLSANLFNLQGVCWRSLRAKLTAAFTSSKINRMYPLMLDCSKDLEEVLDVAAARGEDVDMKDIMARLTIDIIASCAFGVECKSLKNPNTQFRLEGLKALESSWLNKMRLALFRLFPKVGVFRNLLKRSSSNIFFLQTIQKVAEYREGNQLSRGDFLDLLLKMKEKGTIVNTDVDSIHDPFLHVPVSTSSEEFEFTEQRVAAQAYMFFIAGFESSSTTMSFCLLELAHSPDIQDRVRVDVLAAMRKHGGMTYEALADMHYLDKVVSETLRKYSPLSFLVRRCVKPYRVPGSQLVLQPGVNVTIPVEGLHYDPQYYPEPERFDPERFTAEAKAARDPYTYLPFGEGPRMCLGVRFGLVQTKLGLATVLSNYECKPSHRSGFPVVYAKGCPTTINADGCHVKLVKCPSACST